MPGLKKIKETMIGLGIPAEITTQMDFDVDTKGNNPLPVITVVDQMDRLLTKGQKLAVMERQGCCKGGERDAGCKAFNKKYKDKALAEKIELLKADGIPYVFPLALNEDGTLTVAWGGYQNGMHTGNTTCS